MKRVCGPAKRHSFSLFLVGIYNWSFWPMVWVMKKVWSNWPMVRVMEEVRSNWPMVRVLKKVWSKWPMVRVISVWNFQWSYWPRDANNPYKIWGKFHETLRKDFQKVTTNDRNSLTCFIYRLDTLMQTNSELFAKFFAFADCGIRPLARKNGRIVGGKGSTFGEWPWQVLVREATWLGLFTKNKCGGVLITSRYVITAAHCQPGYVLIPALITDRQHPSNHDRHFPLTLKPIFS